MFFYIELISKILSKINGEKYGLSKEDLRIDNDYLMILNNLEKLISELAKLNRTEQRLVRDKLLDLHIEFSNLLWQFYHVNDLLLKLVNDQNLNIEADRNHKNDRGDENLLEDILKQLLEQLQTLDTNKVISYQEWSNGHYSINNLFMCGEDLNDLYKTMAKSFNLKNILSHFQKIFSNILMNLYVIDEIIWKLLRSFSDKKIIGNE